jgi:hypothetical protein
MLAGKRNSGKQSGVCKKRFLLEKLAIASMTKALLRMQVR